jgi:tetratricopeptide (TPR) repeat protein
LRLLFMGFLSLQAEAPAAGERTRRPDDTVAAAELEELERRFELANHYEILSVASDATDADIKASYHQMAKQYHPDLFQSERHSPALRQTAERVFTYVTAAYTTLSNAASRAVYDEQRLTKESQVEAALQARAGVDLDKDKTARALFRVGQDALSGRDFEKAVMTLSECVFLRPDVPRYRLLLGIAQTELPKFRKEAEQNLLKAIELDPMSIESRLALATLYVKVELPRRAEAQYMQVLRWDPHHAEAQRRLGELNTSAKR